MNKRMNKKEAAKKRTAMLKRLREAHQETVQRTQSLLKEQQAIRRAICQTMRDTPKTVLEVAQVTDLPAHEVLWHIIAMKKYNRVVEAGMSGEYYLYQVAKEARK
jgi:predicted Rossmann fold nucleotide-binding protein DprA/Smf involved in DNA uptake